MMKISLEQAESLVKSRRDMFWDGWTIVQVKPHAGAWLRTDGVFRNGKWYIAKRYSLNDEGKYEVAGALGRGL